MPNQFQNPVRPIPARLSRRLVLALTGVALLVALVATPVSALTRSYATQDEGLKVGMVAALAEDAETERVERADSDAPNRAIGIVVNVQSDTLSVVGGDDSGSVYVADNGMAQAYITDLNGLPEYGDLLTPSPLAGILMKATEGSEGIVGMLVASFPENAEVVEVEASGSNKEAKVGIAKVNMDVKATSKNSSVDFLERLGENIVGRKVTALQVMFAIIIMLLVIVVVGGIIYAAVSNYMTAVGRNPLAKGILKRGLINASVLVFAVIAVGMIAIYLVLWI